MGTHIYKDSFEWVVPSMHETLGLISSPTKKRGEWILAAFGHYETIIPHCYFYDPF
jgi:hypothetical protein